MEPIAIIGVSCLFPGAETPEQYWQNLVAQKDSTSQATAAEMGVDANIFYDPVKGTTDKYYCMKGGYIRGFEFDARGYDLPQETLERLDRLYQWSLTVAQQALQDSGYREDEELLSKCGVILGNLSFPTMSSHRLISPIYEQAMQPPLGELLQQEEFTLESLPSLGDRADLNTMISGYPAAVIAQALSLGGMTLALDAACASSLYAVKLACQQLLAGKADLMLAGAVSAADPFCIHSGFSVFQAYPTNDMSRPFDQSAEGLISGEGAGMFVLKRYADAVRDNDQIYAVIRGIGLSNDGKGKFLLSPHPKGQVLAFERAYAEAEVDPKSISYVECHATGTPLGDKTELETMERFFGQHDTIPLIGSVKSNFGHLLTAAGMAGMLKVILSLSHQQIPATINLENAISSPHHRISAPQIVTSTTNWPDQSLKRAGVSAFGFGGTNAHLILEHPAPTPNPSQFLHVVQDDMTRGGEQNPLAIVGMEAFFGPCEGLEAFKRTVYDAREHFIPLPPQRWKGIEAQESVLQAYGMDSAPLGAYIKEFELDFLAFRIPPNEADRPIPQQLLMLKVAHQALQDAGVEEGGNVAVLIAMEAELALHQFRSRCDLSWQIEASLAKQGIRLAPEQKAELEAIAKESIHHPTQVHQYTSFIGNIMASRISAKWDFSGPSFTISAEENSVFKALEVAQLLLAENEVDAVLVGAVDLAGGVENVLLRHQEGGTYGWHVGEGAGAVVLKRLESAEAAEDRIYAVIDNMSLMHAHGRIESSSSASGRLLTEEAVTQACQEAFNATGIAPGEIGYLELFGDGLVRGAEDQTEMKGLRLAYQSTESALNTAIGSVKANIGHTYTASGMASLIKTSLCLYERYIPGLTEEMASRLPAMNEDSPFYLPDGSRPWLPQGASTRRAAISGLGSDGACVHLILSEKHHEQQPTYLQRTAPYLFLIAGNGEAALLEQLDRWAQKIEEADSLSIVASQCWQAYDVEAAYVMAIVGRDTPELRREFERARRGVSRAFENGKEWKTPRGSYFTAHPLGDKSKIAFVYPGAFNAYVGLGQDLLHLFPQLQDEMALFSSKVDELIGERLLYPRRLDSSEEELERLAAQLRANLSTVLISGMSYAWLVTKVLRDYFKVQPDMAFGYSLGETMMMFALDAWGVDDKRAGMLQESPLFTTRLAGPKNAVREYWGLPPVAQAASLSDDDLWGVYLLKAPPGRVKEALANEERVYLTHINMPGEAIIAGDPTACEDVIQRLKCKSIRAPFSEVIHCEPMRSEYEGFFRLNHFPIQEVPERLYFAADDGSQPFNRDTVAHFIAQGLTEVLDFARLVEQVYDDGARIFIELGALNTCTRWVRGNLKGRPHVAQASDHHSKGDQETLVALLAQLVSHRVPLDLSPLYGEAEEPPPQKRSLVKTVTLGGVRIADTILSHEERFKAAATGIPAPTPNPSPNTSPALTVARGGGHERPERVVSQNGSPMARALEALATEATQSAQAAQQQVEASSFVPNFSIPQLPLQESVVQEVTPSSADVYYPTPEVPKTTASRSTPYGLPAQKLTEYVSLITQTHGTFLQMRHQLLEQISQSAKSQISLSQRMLHAPSQLTSPTLPVNKVTGWEPKQVPAPSAPATETSTPTQPHTMGNLLQAQLFRQQGSAVPTAPTVPTVSAPIVPAVPTAPTVPTVSAVPTVVHREVDVPPPAYSQPAKVVWDEAELLEFAEGSIARVFGEEYAIIDTYSRRVRLPMPPYLLVSRVTDIKAERGRYEPSTMQTEYDIPLNAWYSVDGQAPAAVAVESGQCDLLLISYLGIDFDNKGELVYRLLDCTLTFLGELPKEGQTLRYDISIDAFARSGDNLLFFFSYECFVADEMILKMTGGCAGFFSDHQLDQGKGVIRTEDELAARRKIKKQHFTPLLRCEKTAFDENDLKLLSEGNMAACFGPSYNQHGLNRSLRFPNPMMMMIDRILSVDPNGGPWGLGLIVAEKDLYPDGWYFPCHFKDDEVLAGSLIAEGCAQVLHFYILYLGLQTRTQDARLQPILDLSQIVRCRGQTTPKDRRLTYRLEVTEIGLTPLPYIKVNAQVIMNDKVVVDFQDLGWRLAEKSSSTSHRSSITNHQSPSHQSPSHQSPIHQSPITSHQSPVTSRKPVLFDTWKITEFAIGSIAACFGPEFKKYDERHSSRIPNGDLQLISQVLEIDGERYDFKSKVNIVAEYDVLERPWFCEQNSNPLTVPYSIYMELALQPCGFLSAYMGTTIQLPELELYFRNLDGKGTILKEMDLRGKTLTNRSRLLSTTMFNNTILQNFEFEFLCEGEPIYRGTTGFGYFTAPALANQVGLDQGKVIPPWYEEADLTGLSTHEIILASPGMRQQLFTAPADKPYYKLAGEQLNFLDTALVIANGGKHQQGYIYASKMIDPSDWFYVCHFHGDPVMPGSLGIEAILQAMRIFALDQKLGAHLNSPRFAQVVNHEMVWKYRGQIIQSNRKMYLEVHITKIEIETTQVTIMGDASLWKDGMRIYELKDAAIRLVE